MTLFKSQDIRNVAVVAHVDHGKTTLVDAMLKQSYVFRDNQKVGNLIMDSNELERERGITILAKNTAITYDQIKINIIDTPGHADFSGEIERVINMADGVLLVVDAVEGVMPQTEIVLKQALRKLLKPIVVINKIDRPAARPAYVLNMVQDLFLELAVDPDQLDFTVLYAAASDGYAISDLSDTPESIRPLFEAIKNEIPHPKGKTDFPFQLQVASLDYDLHLGQIAIGRILNGEVSKGQKLACMNEFKDPVFFSVSRVFGFGGLQRNEVDLAVAGDIIALTGSDQVSIGDTITHPENLESLPAIDIQEPTVMMTFGVGTSPFSGREGKFCTTPQLRQRLMKELRTNVSLRVQDTSSADEFLVSGRGELHLAILIETMRREGYEFQVSKPEAVTKVVNGIVQEPYEIVIIDTKEEYVGTIYKEMGIRRGEVVDIRSDDFGDPQLEFKISTRGLIGFRSFFLKATRGNGVLNGEFLGYEVCGPQVGRTRPGVLVASASGTAVTYGLNNAQDRGTLFLGPGTEVYEGMVVGFHARDNDIPVNVCKEKKLTNMRSSTAEIAIKLSPPMMMSLEEMLDFIVEDELLEVTPKNLRVRKRILAQGKRQRSERKV